MDEAFENIVKKIDEHLSKSGKRYFSEFYIGTSKNAEKKLFKDHHVDKENSWWIYLTADSTEIAKKVEKHYLDLGMRGTLYSEDEKNPNMVYCYVVTPTTTE